MKKKSMALVLALAMIVVCVVGGTLAWLTAKTPDVKNTFTTSDVSITLEETTKNYKMVPGYTISKDPKVTVVAGSEKCYLFVKVEESTNFNDFMTYEIADGWTSLGGDNVYYRIVDTPDMGTAYSVLKDDQVTVKDTVTKAEMSDLNAEGATQPTLTFTAYACQFMKNNTENFTPAEAWHSVPKT